MVLKDDSFFTTNYLMNYFINKSSLREYFLLPVIVYLTVNKLI